MDAQKKNLWFGIAMIVLALMILMMFGFEIYDGKLEGSRSYGLTRDGTPLVFYISTGLELFLGLLLFAGGVYTIRNRGKEYRS
jgi:hypothetical protein